MSGLTTANSSGTDKPWQFKKGQSGNPSGRPKIDPEVKEILKAASPDAARRLVELMNSEIDKIALKACCEILDRTIGKPETISKLALDENAPKTIIVKWQD